MKILVAPDSLKESLCALDAARAIEKGVATAIPGAEVLLVPFADGGEGTVAAMLEATGGQPRTCQAPGPLGDPVEAQWGVCGDGETAVIEMAAASGLELLDAPDRNPLRTSTRGTGVLIRHALDEGVKRIIVGIGGSATVDGGAGMAHALGVRFLDENGRPIEDPCGGRLVDIRAIETGGLDPRVSDVEVVVACDVTNPLLGPEGAARVYGPQKGATPQQVEALEDGMRNLSERILRDLDKDVSELAGAGAAGGLGAGLVAFLGARLENGAQTIARHLRLRQRMSGCDLVITAEGRLDAQSAYGKAPARVASVAHSLGIPVVALGGALKEGFEALYELGVSAVFCIADGPLASGEAMGRASELLERTAESVARLWLASKGDLK